MTFDPSSLQTFNHSTWAEFKKYLNGTYASLAFQYQEKPDYYIIVTEEYAGITQRYDLLKDAGVDQTDFETTFKNLAPRKPGSFSSQQVYGQNASGTSLTTNPVTISGSDGTNVRTLRTATDGTLRIDPTGSTTQPVSGTITANAGTGNFSIVGTGTAGSSAGGVLSIQGVAGGVAVPISGTISATNPSVSTTGATTPTSATLIGASDGTNLQALRSSNTTPGGTEQGLIVRNIPSGTQTVSGSGNFTVVQATAASLNATVIGTGSAGTPATGVITVQGIASGTSINVAQATASSLRTQTASEATSGSTAPTVSNLIGASDGTNIQSLRTTTTTPGGTEQGLIVRNIPSGTQTVSGSGNFTVVQATAGNLNATVTGTVTANQGGTWTVQPGNTANTTPWLATINQGGNSAVVKAASTAAVATDPALVVALSPNNPILMSSADTTATGTLNALNAAVSVNLAGQTGAGFQLAAGTLIGTIVPEISFDGGTTWIQTQFDDATTGVKSSSIVFAANNTATARSIICGSGSSQARVRVSAFTSGTTNITLKASMVSDPSLLFTGASGSTAPSVTGQIGGSDGTNLRTLKTSTDGTLATYSIDTPKTTYSATAVSFAPAATPTDIFTISGSATKTVRVTRVILVATQTTAAMRDVLLVKRSTANTGGTSAAPAKVPYDSTNAAATNTVLNYTANPATLGTSLGNVFAQKMFIPAATAVAGVLDIQFGIRNTQAVVLRGTGELLCVNLNGVTSTGNSVTITVEWTEE